VFAAWSSSGVINPALDYDGYDRDVFEATSKSGPCAQILQNITFYIEEVFNNSETRQSEYLYIH
jgi:hypothetical protein